MAIRIDPENNETRALFDMVNFSGQHVLEIGCGDGRVTWRYADKAAHVTAIDPAAKQIALAREQLPSQLQDRIEFQQHRIRRLRRRQRTVSLRHRDFVLVIVLNGIWGHGSCP